MTKVFEHAENEVLKDMPVNDRKVYHLNKWINEITEEIKFFTKEGFSPHGDFVLGFQQQLINFIKLRGEVLRQ